MVGDRDPQEFIGYVSDDAEDLCVELNETRWVNVDHQFGFVFRGSGKTFYRNPHHFKVWHAIKEGGDRICISQ